MPYVKLDSEILTSSVWVEDHETFRVWIYLLAAADANGTVHATVPAIALLCQLSQARTQEILEKFAAPDPHSRTPDKHGRRIEITYEPHFEILLVNYEAHRRRAYTNAERQRNFRDRHRNATVTKHNAVSHAVTQAEAEAEAEAVTTETKSVRSRAPFVPPTLAEVQAYVKGKGYTFNPEAFVAHYTANGWKVGRSPMRDWRAACTTWQTRETPQRTTGPRRAAQRAGLDDERRAAFADMDRELDEKGVIGETSD